MAEPRRLHPSAVVIYSASALRNFAFPLLVIVAVTLLGGAFDGRGLLRALAYGGAGLVMAVLACATGPRGTRSTTRRSTTTRGS
jgi:putative membrane protein